jgi:tryptophan 2,3-dioxygenase
MAAKMNYEAYILPHHLPEVRPRERRGGGRPDSPDEAFFIRTHQALEVWFAQILDELTYARYLLSQPAPYFVPESDIPAIVKHLRRAAGIFDLAREHMPLLETLDTTSFYNFRKHLFGASGTQSYRFREVEWMMGMLEPGLCRYARQKLDLDRRLGASDDSPAEREYTSLQEYQAQWTARWDKRRRQFRTDDFDALPATGEALGQRLSDIAEHGTLREHALKWLGRTAFPPPRRARPDPKYGDLFTQRFETAFMAAQGNDLSAMATLRGLSKREITQAGRDAMRRMRFFFKQPDRRAIVFLLQYAEQPLLSWPASVIEALLELEEAFGNWRDRHIAMVARVLGGGRISTLGSAGSGLQYLRATLPKRAFPELWDARSFLLSHDEAKGIYSARQLDAYGFLTETKARGPSARP